MEKIALRAIIVLSVIAIVIGGSLVFLGNQRVDRASDALDYEYSRSESKEFRDCKADAITQDDAELVKSCYALFGPDPHSIGVHNSTMSRASEQMNFGTALAVGVPVLLFLGFYLLRWILTG